MMKRIVRLKYGACFSLTLPSCWNSAHWSYDRVCIECWFLKSQYCFPVEIAFSWQPAENPGLHRLWNVWKPLPYMLRVSKYKGNAFFFFFRNNTSSLLLMVLLLDVAHVFLYLGLFQAFLSSFFPSCKTYFCHPRNTTPSFFERWMFPERNAFLHAKVVFSFSYYVPNSLFGKKNPILGPFTLFLI